MSGLRCRSSWMMGSGRIAGEDDQFVLVAENEAGAIIAVTPEGYERLTKFARKPLVV